MCTSIAPAFNSAALIADAVAPVVTDYFRRIEGAYATALGRATARGELAPETDVQALARFFLAVHISLCVMSRAGEPTGVLADAAAVAIQRLH